MNPEEQALEMHRETADASPGTDAINACIDHSRGDNCEVGVIVIDLAGAHAADEARAVQVRVQRVVGPTHTFLRGSNQLVAVTQAARGDEASIARVAEQLNDELALANELHTNGVTLAVGWAVSSDEVHLAEDLLQSADVATLMARVGVAH